MKQNLVDLTLPEWAWVDGGDHEEGGNPLAGRSVFMHVRSATVMEVFDRDLVVAKEGVLQYDFGFHNSFGITEQLTLLMHFSPFLNAEDDYDRLMKILKAGAEWYMDYCTWEDTNIQEDDISTLN